MLKVLSRISMVLFLVASPFLLYGFGSKFAISLSDISIGDPRWFWFIVGSGTLLPVYLFANRFLPSVWNYLATLEHEFAHLLVGLLFLKIPVGLKVTAHRGGEVRQVGFGNNGETWITLAPYFFPTLSILIVSVAFFLPIPDSYLMAALGFSTFYHIVTNWAETSFRQPDLQRAGWLKCVFILPLMNVICYGAVFSYVADGKHCFTSFFREGSSDSMVAATNFGAAALEEIRQVTSATRTANNP